MARTRIVTTFVVEKPHKFTGPDDIEVRIEPGGCDDGCRSDIVVMTVNETLELHLNDEERKAIVQSLGGTFNG